MKEEFVPRMVVEFSREKPADDGAFIEETGSDIPLASATPNGVAESTGLEPATSAVTGRRSNRLS